MSYRVESRGEAAGVWALYPHCTRQGLGRAYGSRGNGGQRQGSVYILYRSYTRLYLTYITAVFVNLSISRLLHRGVVTLPPDKVVAEYRCSTHPTCFNRAASALSKL